jgi:uncharacterized protein (TIGR02266 family)
MNRPARKPDGPPDQRAEPRIDLHAEVDVWCEHDFHRAVIQDMSQGGMFVSTDRRLPIGERVNLTFTVPGSAGLLHVEAKVRWVRESSSAGNPDNGGMGLQFLRLSAEARQTIARFLLARDAVKFGQRKDRAD